MANHRPKPTIQPLFSKGTLNGASKVTTEGRLAVTEATRDRQDETSGAMVAFAIAGEEPGAGASSGQGSQQQERARSAVNREEPAHMISKNYANRRPKLGRLERSTGGKEAVHRKGGDKEAGHGRPEEASTKNRWEEELPETGIPHDKRAGSGDRRE